MVILLSSLTYAPYTTRASITSWRPSSSKCTNSVDREPPGPSGAAVLNLIMHTLPAFHLKPLKEGLCLALVLLLFSMSFQCLSSPRPRSETNGIPFHSGRCGEDGTIKSSHKKSRSLPWSSPAYLWGSLVRQQVSSVEVFFYLPFFRVRTLLSSAEVVVSRPRKRERAGHV